MQLTGCWQRSIESSQHTAVIKALIQGSGTYGSRAIYGSSGDGIWLKDNFEFKKKISARHPVIFSIAPDTAEVI